MRGLWGPTDHKGLPLLWVASPASDGRSLLLKMHVLVVGLGEVELDSPSVSVCIHGPRRTQALEEELSPTTVVRM